MTVEEYVSSVKRNNHNAVFSTKLMSQNRYQYRGFEYRFSELVNTKARIWRYRVFTITRLPREKSYLSSLFSHGRGQQVKH